LFSNSSTDHRREDRAEQQQSIGYDFVYGAYFSEESPISKTEAYSLKEKVHILCDRNPLPSNENIPIPGGMKG